MFDYSKADEEIRGIVDAVEPMMIAVLKSVARR